MLVRCARQPALHDLTQLGAGVACSLGMGRASLGALGIAVTAACSGSPSVPSTAPHGAVAIALPAPIDSPARPVVPCRLEGTHLTGWLLDEQGERLARLDLRGGSFEVTVDASGAKARGRRTAIVLDAALGVAEMHIWPRARVELVAGHAWIEPVSAMGLSRIDADGLWLVAGGKEKLANRGFPCEDFSLTPGPPPELPRFDRRSHEHGPYTARRMGLPLVDDRGETITTLPTRVGDALYGLEVNDVREGWLRVRLAHEGVELDAWVREDDIEAPRWGLGTVGSLSGTVGGPGLGRLHDARVPPAPPRAGRILRATPLLAGASATAARATGVTLDVEQSVLVSRVEADRAAISFSDRAISLERQPLWVERADLELR